MKNSLLMGISFLLIGCNQAIDKCESKGGTLVSSVRGHVCINNNALIRESI